jgi:hypothetical protein
LIDFPSTEQTEAHIIVAPVLRGHEIKVPVPLGARQSVK